MPVGVKNVIVRNTVLAGACLDIHLGILLVASP